MTIYDEETGRSATDLEPADDNNDYEVGYGKPPKHSRFKKGKSGNPKGRPKGTRNFATDAKEALAAPVSVTRGGKRTMVSSQRAAILKLREKALQGDIRAMERFLELGRLFNDIELPEEQPELSATDEEILNAFINRSHSASGELGNPEPSAEVADAEQASNEPCQELEQEEDDYDWLEGVLKMMDTSKLNPVTEHGLVTRRQALNAVLRSDLTTFVHKAFNTVSPGDRYLHNWHIEAIAYQLKRCIDGESQRLLITQPPRSLKSICTSVAFVAWALGHNPKLRFICVSYSDDLAKDLARQFRMVIESQWYRDLFPLMKLKKDTGTECITTKGGGRLATSIGGTLTGRGADVIIVDDPLKAEEARRQSSRDAVNNWYATTLISRLNDKRTGIMILVMQRLHEEDLAGFVLQREMWEQLDLPAIADDDQTIAVGPSRTHHRKRGDVLHPEREPLPVLEKLRARIGDLTFSAQYMQRPVPAGGNVVKREWIKHYDQLPPDEAKVQIIQSWDVATTLNENSSFSVCTTWTVQGKTYYLADVWRGKLEFPALKAKVTALAKDHQVNTILIEDTGPGLHLLQELRNDNTPGVPWPIGIKPDADKETRMIAQSSRFEAGQVLLPKDAHWLGAFLSELLGFPNTKHDDQVDSVSQFLRWVTRSGAHQSPPPYGGKLFENGMLVCGHDFLDY